MIHKLIASVIHIYTCHVTKTLAVLKGLQEVLRLVPNSCLIDKPHCQTNRNYLQAKMVQDSNPSGLGIPRLILPKFCSSNSMLRTVTRSGDKLRLSIMVLWKLKELILLIYLPQVSNEASETTIFLRLSGSSDPCIAGIPARKEKEENKRKRHITLCWEMSQLLLP